MSSAELTSTGSSQNDPEVNNALDAFEQLWTDPTCAPDILQKCESLQSQLAGEPDADDRMARAVFELALVDIELRWRSTNAALRRCAHWYRTHLQPFGFSDENLFELALNEFEVRCRWGDQPLIEDLVEEQFPDFTPDERRPIVRRFHSELELRFPIECRVTFELTERFRANLKTPCIVGRQRSRDPLHHVILFSEQDDVWRLVVAGRSENFISRKQLRIKRLSLDILEVTPLSTSVACYLSNRRLPSLEKTRVKLSSRGSALSFGGITLHLRCI